MTTCDSNEPFYASIPVFRGFGSLMDPVLYSPLPDDWTIGVADIVESTKAIANERYKAVNMAGARGAAPPTPPQRGGGAQLPCCFGRRGCRFCGGARRSRSRARRPRGDRDL